MEVGAQPDGGTGSADDGVGSGSVTAVEYRARFPIDARVPAQARRLVRCLEHTVDHAELENVELLVTELVTNAIRHAGLGTAGWVGVELVVTPDVVRVEVADPGRGFDPHVLPGAAGEERGSGWGLFLVDQLSQRWGVHTDEFTRVWFEVPASPARTYLQGASFVQG